MTTRRRVRSFLATRLAVDARALAAFRVGIGVTLLLDLGLRVGDAAAFYTDAGVLPRAVLFDAYPGVGRASLHVLSGALWWQLLLFGATALAALALVAGFHSRLAALVAFLLVLSLHARNPVVLNAGDSLLRRLLLWSVLLPVGARWGLDADDTGDSPGPVLTAATAGVLVQVLVVYLVNAALKLRGEAWHAGTAVRYVFGVDALTVGLGDVLAGHATLLTLGAYAWLVLLTVAPLLVLTTGRTRALLAGTFAASHLFMAVTLRLGVFPLVSAAAVLLFVPTGVWDRVEERLDPLIDRLAGRGPRPRSLRPVGSGMTGRSVRAVAVVLLAFVLVWTAAGVGLVTLPADVTGAVDPQERRWDMFAPEPLRTDGWYVTRGETTAGRQVDAFAGQATVDPPPDATATYPSHRWYVYLTDLRRPSGASLRPAFARYLCERWDRRHDGELARVDVTVVTETVRLDGPDPRDRRRFETHSCPA